MVARLSKGFALTHKQQTLDIIHTSFPRALTSYLPDLLSSSLHHLQTLYPTFVHYYISSSDSVPHTSEDEIIELPQLIVPIIDFVSNVARGGKARGWFDAQRFPALVSAIFRFTQMTEEDVSSGSHEKHQSLTVDLGRDLGSESQCLCCSGG